jgi:hypothetical protein
LARVPPPLRRPLQTCLANGIDGFQYHKALFAELPKAVTAEDFEALTPWRNALDRR